MMKRLSRRCSRAAMVAATLMVLTGAMARAGDADSEIGQFIATARRMNPEIQTMALDADAAANRVDAAGALDDPKFKTELMIPRSTPGYLPGRRAEEELYQIRQMLPFWGKRELKRDIAEWDSRRASAQQAEIESQISYRVKVAYAEYHAAHLAADETRGLLGTMSRLAELARVRYAQGPGRQQDITGASAERGTLTGELARLEADRRRAQVRLNGLLARAPDTPLPSKPQPRAVPPVGTRSVAVLLDRAMRDYPAIRVQQARVQSADASRQLVDRNGYPDVELGVGAVRRDGRFDGYQAMIELNIPLQVDRRRAEQREAAAMTGSARAKLDQIRLEVTTELHEAYAMLGALRERKRIVREITLPQARIAVGSAMRGYELAREEASSVLLAQQTLRRAIVEFVNVTFEEQVRLAEIERLIGGEL